jgi:pyroglutamyl-peptidase
MDRKVVGLQKLRIIIHTVYIPKMPTVLITGFGPFDGVPENPTEKIVKLFERENSIKREGWTVVYKVMEVSVSECSKFHTEVKSSVEELPDVYIHLGVNGHGTCIQLEQTAYNNMTFRCADESGFKAEKQKIDESRELECPIHTAFDLKKIVDSVNDTAEIMKDDIKPMVVSTDPGRFLCNYIYFQSLLNLEADTKSAKAVFCHIPPFEVISMDTQVPLLKKVMNSILSQEIV